MKEFDPQEMDLAAQRAADELDRMNKEAVKTVADWFAKHYLQAGHKRLGRVLVAKSKE